MKLVILMALESPWSRQAALRLAGQGHEIHIVDFDRSATSHSGAGAAASYLAQDIAPLYNTAASINLLKTKLKPYPAYIPLASFISKVCKSVRADALLTLYGGGFALAACLSGFRPYAVYIVGSDIALLHGVRSLLSKIVLNSAGTILVNGGYITNLTQKLVPNKNVVSLLFGVPTDIFSPVDNKSDTVRIVCSRSFKPVYNNEYIIQSLALLKPDIHRFNFTFTSAGPALESAKKLAENILPKDILPTVDFLGGVSDAQLLEKVRNSHIYVSMSRSDGTSTALLEAMSCGLFPVLSDIPQNREWLDPAAKNGILVPLDQPGKLASALTRAIEDKQMCRLAGEYNRNLILECADARKNSQILAEKLEFMIRNY